MRSRHSSCSALLILKANPLEDIRNTRSVEVVISKGHVVDRAALLRRTR